jgi:hypothetical protein
MSDNYKDRLKRGEMTVSPCSRQDIATFIEEHHYSKSINGVKASYCFRLLNQGQLVGAMLFGTLGMANAWKKYGSSEGDVLELRRLCLIDETPKNSETFFIGQALRWLKNNTSVKTIVSYADPNHGHEGTIYKASNFLHQGMTSKGRVILFDGKKYHDKAVRAKYKDRLKPFAIRLQEALDAGIAVYTEQKPKHIYTYQLRGK